MSRLGTYLNDHLAGSVVALELLRRLADDPAAPGAGDLTRLHGDIADDRAALEALLDRLGVRENPARQAAGWLADKLGALKLRWDDPTDGAFRRLESLEIVALGVTGKRGLWRALAQLAPELPNLAGVDFAALGERAESQFARLERLRLAAARDAFLGDE